MQPGNASSSLPSAGVLLGDELCGVPSVVGMVPGKSEKEDEDAISAQLAGLAQLTKDLGEAVKCPICLEHIDCAQQLHCGHLFCAEDIGRIVRQPQPKCPVCKVRTSKRSVRASPVDFAEIVSCLRDLEAIVEESTAKVKDAAEPATKVNDGFAANTSKQLAIRRVSGVGAVPSRASPGKQLATRRASGGGPGPFGASIGASSSSTVSPRRPARSLPLFDVHPGKDECVLCPSPGIVEGDEMVDYGKPKCPVGDKDGRELTVHENCGAFSHGTHEVDFEFWGVTQALKRARGLSCSREGCNAPNPTTKCASAGCDKVYHYSCAVVDGAKCVVDGYKMFCKDHKGDAPDTEENDFEECRVDPDGAASRSHDDLCWKCHTGGNMVLCDSCPHVVHLACAGLRALPIGDYFCGYCTARGLHVLEDSDCTPSGTPPQDEAETLSQPQSQTKSQKKGSSKKRVAGRASIGKSGVKKSSKRARVSMVSQGTGEDILRPVLCSTGLDEAQKALLKGIAGPKRTQIRPEFDSKVTHMVINAFQPAETPRRTMKLCKAIAAGVQLICFKWVEDAAGPGALPTISDYVHPWTRSEADGPLFAGARFYFGGLRAKTPNKEELIAIVKLGGGTVLNRVPTIDMAPSSQKLYVIQDLSKKQKGGSSRRNSSTFVADGIPGAEVVDSTWILDQCTSSAKG